MKQGPIHFVGLDVHQSTIVVSAREESGKVVMNATVPTEEKAIVAAMVERVVVCNVRGKGALANKNDRIDANELSERLRLGALKPVFHGAPEMLTLGELVARLQPAHRRHDSGDAADQGDLPRGGCRE